MIPPLFARYSQTIHIRTVLSLRPPEKGAQIQKRRTKNGGETKMEATKRTGAAQYPLLYTLVVGTGVAKGWQHTSRTPLFLDDALENAMFLAPANFPPRSFVWQNDVNNASEWKLAIVRTATDHLHLRFFLHFSRSFNVSHSFSLSLFIPRSSGVQFPLFVSIHPSNGSGGIEREEKRSSLLFPRLET